MSCADVDHSQDDIIFSYRKNVSSGEVLVINYDSIQSYSKVYASLVDKNDEVIESYPKQRFGNSYVINRFLNKRIALQEEVTIRMNFLDDDKVLLETKELQINVAPSVVVETLCSSPDCSTLSGNVVQNAINKLSVKTYRFAATKFVYIIKSPYFEDLIEHSFTSPVDNDYLDRIVMQNVPQELSSYVASLTIIASNQSGEEVETVLPFRVVRPIEVKHFGEYELAEVYEPQPVTGCIPGSVGNNVNYSETSSETRQNSVNITLSTSTSNSMSSGATSSSSEGLSIGNTTSTVNSSSMSSSETNSEGYGSTYAESESVNIGLSSSDGETWAWSTTDTTSSTQSGTETSGSNTGVSGSVTTGFSGEGSLPFLAKASGKVEVTGGIQQGWNSSTSESQSTSDSNARGYTASGSTNSSKSYGSATTSTSGHSLSGSYAQTSNRGQSTSSGSTNSSSKVWNMSESISSGRVLTQGDQESISETIVSSSTSSTTFSYSAYIPRGRFGIFYRQTSRYVKLSEIITYDLNGIPKHSGFIVMNNWAWAPELSIGNDCLDMPEPSLPKAQCFIEPCGE